MDILFSVFLMGLLGGVHCLGMCGGVVALLNAGLDGDIRLNRSKTSSFHLYYNFGRVLSYVLIGAVFGLIGDLLSIALQMSVFDKVLRLFSGVLMVMVGLYIANWSSSIQILEKIGAKVWVKLQPLISKLLPINKPKSAFVVGLVWGGMPCGLVYGALSFAILSASSLDGGVIMLAFGIGTLPSLFLMAGFSAQIGHLSNNLLARRISGVLIIVLGFSAIWVPFKSIF
ncbi:MAG: sulfite exporter TauE/SafE family protein [Gammaproteobacteria bacterium]|nr:sulfite exporter TauE/SafE family protein [Gammaproteobacteria bacterium]